MKTIRIIFDTQTPAPALGYLVKYREVGTVPWTTISPNPMGSPVYIDVPDGKNWEGTVQAVCSGGSSSPEKSWSVSDAMRAMIYISNSSSAGGTGMDVWFSQNDYYSSGGSGVLLRLPNVYAPAQLGAQPNISITFKYWRNDVTNTIDTGAGVVRMQDGMGSINPFDNNLSWDTFLNSWRRETGILSAAEGANIAAIQITNAWPALFTYNGTTYQLALPPANSIIRVKNTFLAGTTGVDFFDI